MKRPNSILMAEHLATVSDEHAVASITESGSGWSTDGRTIRMSPDREYGRNGSFAVYKLTHYSPYARRIDKVWIGRPAQPDNDVRTWELDGEGYYGASYETFTRKDGTKANRELAFRVTRDGRVVPLPPGDMLKELKQYPDW